MEGGVSRELQISVKGTLLNKVHIHQQYALIESLESKDDGKNQEISKEQIQQFQDQRININELSDDKMKREIDLGVTHIVYDPSIGPQVDDVVNQRLDAKTTIVFEEDFNGAIEMEMVEFAFQEVVNYDNEANVE